MLAFAMNRQSCILLMQRQMACFAEERNVSPSEVFCFRGAQAGIGQQLDIGVQPNSIGTNAPGDCPLRPDTSILGLNDLELRVVFVDALGAFDDQLFILFGLEAGAVIVGCFLRSDLRQVQRLAIAPACGLIEQLAQDDHFAIHRGQSRDLAWSRAAENTTIFAFAVDFSILEPGPLVQQVLRHSRYRSTSAVVVRSMALFLKYATGKRRMIGGQNVG